MFYNLIRQILFPPTCAGCDALLADGCLCETCRETIILNRTLFCGTCGLRLPEGRKVCHRDAPHLLGAAADYGIPALRGLVHELKFRYRQECAIALADLAFRYLQNLGIDLSSFSIVPVPLSARRRRERGFNQSELIGRNLSALMQLPIHANALARVKHARPQSESSDIRERRNNVLHAFRVPPGITPPAHIILIDDVTTSGATFRAAATALRIGGARRVVAIAAARA